MILITGANGHLGSHVINFMLDKKSGEDIAGLVRSEQKGAELRQKGVQLRIGDYWDRASLNQAVQGVKILLLISTSSLKNVAEQHKNMIVAAKQAGVSRIYYTSFVQAHKNLSALSPEHLETEKMLKDSGIICTIHRHTFYTALVPMILGGALDTGSWKFPSAGQKVNFACRPEMAEALANVLSEPAEHLNETYEITSTRMYTFEELAERLSEAAGRKITYTDVSVDDYLEQQKKAGVKDVMLAEIRVVAETISNGGVSHSSDDLQRLLGREPRSTEQFIREFVKQEV